jgi:tetratricopeptide (TPR) repeat protein
MPAVVISAVSGTAGVGKTALAVRWAHRISGRFPDGQLYVNLRGYDPDLPMPPGDALAGFLRGLGVSGEDIPLDLDERAARYRTELAGRRVLVVLDNAASVEQVRPLLPGTPTATVVVTSRDALAGLVALHGARRLDLDLLPRPDAITLLRRLIGPDRVDADPQAAAELAAECAGLPLALRVAAELAVARPTEPLAELVSELADRQQRLRALDTGDDPRAAVAEVFSWSVEHLPAAAARVFRLLGLHPGPDLDAYAAAALTDTTLPRARQALDTLARAHLVQPAGGRYGMHDLLRAYATHLTYQEDTDEQWRAAQTRLFDYYLATTATAVDTRHPADAHHRPRISAPATPVPHFDGEPQALAWLDAERAVLAAGCAYTAAHGWPAHTVALAATLFRYLDTGGHYADAVAIHDHARRAAHDIGDRAGEATALTNLGVVDWRKGTYERAAEHYQQALDLLQPAGDRDGRARALTNLGVVHWRQGHYGPAAEHLEQALALYRQTGDRDGEASALVNLGNIRWQQGRYEQARVWQEQALRLFRQTGDRDGEAIALNNIGNVHMSKGRYEQAIRYMEQALDLNQRASNRDGVAYALNNLGGIHARQGRHEKAASHYRQALDLVRQTGNQTGEADALAGLGAVYRRQGHYGPAVEHLEQALALYRQTGDRDGEAGALNALGDAARAAGHPEPALDRHASALTLATDTGDRFQQARAHDGLAHAHDTLAHAHHTLAHADHTLAHKAEAGRHWRHALALFTDLGTPEAAEVQAALTALDRADTPG